MSKETSAPDDVRAALEECRSLLADLTSTRPGDNPGGVTILTFYARCIEAEARARAALARPAASAGVGEEK